MAEDKKALALLKRQYERTWNAPGWKKFRDVRTQSWDPLIRRQSPQTLNPEAAQFLQSTNTVVDIQSPDLEKDLHDRKAIQMANAAKIDAISLDAATKAKEDVEEIRIYSAGSWLKQDDGGEIRSHAFEQMDRWGVALLEKVWSKPDEYDADEEMGDPKKALSKRDQYYRDSDHECFSWRAAPPPPKGPGGPPPPPPLVSRGSH